MDSEDNIITNENIEWLKENQKWLKKLYNARGDFINVSHSTDSINSLDMDVLNEVSTQMGYIQSVAQIRGQIMQVSTLSGEMMEIIDTIEELKSISYNLETLKVVAENLDLFSLAKRLIVDLQVVTANIEEIDKASKLNPNHITKNAELEAKMDKILDKLTHINKVVAIADDISSLANQSETLADLDKSMLTMAEVKDAVTKIYKEVKQSEEVMLGSVSRVEELYAEMEANNG